MTFHDGRALILSGFVNLGSLNSVPMPKLKSEHNNRHFDKNVGLLKVYPNQLLESIWAKFYPRNPNPRSDFWSGVAFPVFDQILITHSKY